MQSRAHLGAAEEHDAEEARLEEEGAQHLVTHERADDGPRPVGEDRPVGAELVGHHDARDHAHAEGDGEDHLPVVEEPQVEIVAGPQMQAVQDGEIAREANGEGREDDVERHRERELEPREVQCLKSEHRPFPTPCLRSYIDFYM